MSDEKKLPATAKRLSTLRSKGNVPKSQELTIAAVLTVMLFGMLYYGQYFASEMSRIMIQCFTEMAKTSSQISLEGAITSVLSSSLIFAMIVLAAVLIVAVVLSQVLQTNGLLFIPDRMTQQGFEAFNPVNGVKRLFSPQKLMMTITAMIKMALICSFARSALSEMISYNVFIGPVNVQELGNFYATAAWAIGWRIVLALMIISTIDIVYQRWQYSRDNRMSLQEVRDEGKQQETSPEVKKKMRGMAHKLVSMRRMMENVSDATIVITNPTHYAVALRYVRDVTPAPILLAKGMNRNARKIREKAESLGVAVQENKSIAQGLYKHGQVGKPIPPIYYQAVAQVLAELFRRGYRRR